MLVAPAAGRGGRRSPRVTHGLAGPQGRGIQVADVAQAQHEVGRIGAELCDAVAHVLPGHLLLTGRAHADRPEVRGIGPLRSIHVAPGRVARARDLQAATVGRARQCRAEPARAVRGGEQQQRLFARQAGRSWVRRGPAGPGSRGGRGSHPATTPPVDPSRANNRTRVPPGSRHGRRIRGWEASATMGRAGSTWCSGGFRGRKNAGTRQSPRGPSRRGSTPPNDSPMKCRPWRDDVGLHRLTPSWSSASGRLAGLPAFCSASVGLTTSSWLL